MKTARYDIRFMLTELSGLLIALERLFACKRRGPRRDVEVRYH